MGGFGGKCCTTQGGIGNTPLKIFKILYNPKLKTWKLLYNHKVKSNFKIFFIQCRRHFPTLVRSQSVRCTSSTCRLPWACHCRTRSRSQSWSRPCSWCRTFLWWMKSVNSFWKSKISFQNLEIQIVIAANSLSRIRSCRIYAPLRNPSRH